MKKIATLVLTLCVLFNLYAQNNFDTADLSTLKNNNSLSNLSLQSTNLDSGAGGADMMPVKKGISIMPAAGTKSFKVLYTSQVSDNAAIAIFNEDGKMLITQKAPLLVGKNNIVINNFSSLPEGAYSVSLVSKGTTYTSSFIVWK